MKKKQVSPWVFLGLGMFSLAMAALPVCGFVMAQDSTGRIVFSGALGYNLAAQTTIAQLIRQHMSQFSSAALHSAGDSYNSHDILLEWISTQKLNSPIFWPSCLMIVLDQLLMALIYYFQIFLSKDDLELFYQTSSIK